MPPTNMKNYGLQTDLAVGLGLGDQLQAQTDEATEEARKRAQDKSIANDNTNPLGLLGSMMGMRP